MKDVTCPTCGVTSQVPNEARAYRCGNCWALVERLNTDRPRVRNPAAQTLWTVGAVIVGIVLLRLILQLVVDLFYALF